VTDTVDCVVVGAGVIGLAVARALALQGREVLVVEREALIGSGISSRNSEVIHAGIYYPKGSLKARLCVEGRQRLYAHCASHGVEHRRCGKLIVAANDAQIADLHAIKVAAEANGVDDLAWLDGPEARRLEPALRAVAALSSPSTGIIDSHGYMLSLQGEAEANGAMLAFGTELTAVRPTPAGLALTFAGDDAPSLVARTLVNAAGLFAPAIAAATEGLAPQHQPTAHYAKGSYFTLAGRSPFSRLIYPVPEPGGLGVHLTLDLGGQARFGPDVEWVDDLDYAVNPARAQKFYGAVRAYWPDLADGQLSPAYSGIRPKLSGPGEPAADFRIDGPGDHGVPGLINLFGIESPGLTASLALADLVAEHARERSDA
jgi:L-2-hydroxyglutarate oxidase LhgO